MRITTAAKSIIFLSAILFGALFSHPASALYGDVSSFIGKVYAGDGGSARGAWLDFPEDVNFDSAGNIYVADTGNNVIRKITPGRVISTYAGSGHYGFYNAPGGSAEFAAPKGLAIDPAGNIYVADTDNSLIRKIDVYRGVSTVVSNTLKKPQGVAIFGRTLYVADTGNNSVKKFNLDTGRIDILTADVKAPKKLVVNGSGSKVYVTDSGNNRIVSVDTLTGLTRLVAGGKYGYKEGMGADAKFENLQGIALDGDTLYIGDGAGDGSGTDNRIRTISVATKTTALLTSNDRFHNLCAPYGLRVRGGKIYTANTGHGTIESFNKTTGLHTASDWIAGTDRFGYRNGSIGEALVGRPSAVVESPDRTKLYIADNNRIRAVDLETRKVSLVVGNAIDDYVGEEPTGVDARFSNITSLAVSPDGTKLYIVDRWNNRIRGVDIANQSTWLIAGGGNHNAFGPSNGYREGIGNKARFDHPFGITISPDGKTLYVTDAANRRIRKIVIATGQTSLVAGSGDQAYANGKGAAASFRSPAGITIDKTGKNLYVADRDSHTIRMIRLSDGLVTTVVGKDRRMGYRDGVGDSAVLALPLYVSFGSDGRLYFTDAGSHRVRVIELVSRVTKLVAGSGGRGYHDGPRKQAKFNSLGGIAVDVPAKTMFVADTQNDLIRRIDISGAPPYTDPAPVIQGVLPGTLREQSNPLSIAYLDVVGGNFIFGESTKFGDFNATTYGKSSSALTVVIPIGRMEPGWYDVEVRHLDGQRAVLANGFGVSYASGAVPDIHHQIVETDGFLAYDASFTGGVNLATGDLNNDGRAEIITAPASGGGPQVRMFDQSGKLKGQFLVYDSAWRGGLTVASCDLDDDSRAEIITGNAAGQSAEIKIFSHSGKFIRNFQAFSRTIRVGASVACGDVNGDGQVEIVAAPRSPAGAQVRVFSARGKVLGQWFAYPTTARLGLEIAVGDVNKDGQAEIAVTPLTTGEPKIKIFRYRGHLLGQFSSYPTTIRAGYNIDIGDINDNGTSEIVTGLETGYAPQVRGFNQVGKVRSSFFAFSSRLRTGVHVAAGDVNADGIAEIIATPATGRPTIQVFDRLGNIL